jgi:ERCC4-type nuclease
VALVDSREQKPLSLDMPCRQTCLTTGDYSVVGLENHVAVERKSLEDLVGCVGRSRERFEREIQRLRAFETRAIIVEASWADLEAGGWRGDVSAASVVGSVLGWIASGIPVLLVGSRERAAAAVTRLLFIAARRRFRELQALGRATQVPVGEVPKKRARFSRISAGEGA